MAIQIEEPCVERVDEFLAAVRRSRSLHRGLVTPPSTIEQYCAYLARISRQNARGHLVCLESGEVAGVININEIVRGPLQSGYLGYYALTPHAGRGHMREGLRIVVARAFREYGLHRLEANIQPHNGRSRSLVEGLGFRYEGFSPRYLKVAGRWRDHERWALTAEDHADASRTARRRRLASTAQASSAAQRGP